jgi:hypothetical protein
MKLIYQADRMAIVQDDAEKTVVARLTADAHKEVSITALAKAMAAAPIFACVLDYLMDIEADKYGDRTISSEGMQPIRDALSALTVEEAVDMIHFTLMVK